MKIPDFLSHLKQDRLGRPVPWINTWGAEAVERFRIEFDSNVRMPAVFIEDYGTDPDFTRQSPQRQRESVVHGLCQICARHVPWSRRFLALSQQISIDTIELGGRTVRVVTEPWLRRRREEDLALLPITSQRQVQFVMSRGYIDGPLEALSREVKPAMWCKIMLVGAGA